MILKLTELSVGYGGFTATHGLELGVREGTVFALIGANGAGKSSTIMAIAGHVEVQHGRIEFDGRDIAGVPVHRRAALGIAVAPEGRRLFGELTVQENLMLGGYTRPGIETQQGEADVVDLFPRLKERWGQRAATLSGGEQQMLAIGRALMARPKLLMIDEVSLGLMPRAIDVCYDAIAKLRARGITVLLVEQSTQKALAAADDVCVLESGRIVWSGTAAEARDDPAMIEAYMGLQERPS